MGKGYQGRHKGDVAIDNLLKDARTAKYKDRVGESDNTIIDKCREKSTRKYPKRVTDPGLTARIAEGYTGEKERRIKSQQRIKDKARDAELAELSEKTGIPVEILRKNPSLRPINWTETSEALLNTDLNHTNDNPSSPNNPSSPDEKSSKETE